MKARAAVLTAVTALVPLAVLSPAAASVSGLIASHDATLRITNGDEALARAAWHESGDMLCVHAARREALARFRTTTGRVVQVVDVAGGSYWSCTPNLNVPEDDRVKMVLRWKALGPHEYARTVATRIRT
jgi:hypothetical protein